MLKLFKTTSKKKLLCECIHCINIVQVYVSLMDTVLVVGRCVTRPGIGKVIQVHNAIVVMRTPCV